MMSHEEWITSVSFDKGEEVVPHNNGKQLQQGGCKYLDMLCKEETHTLATKEWLGVEDF